MWTCNQAKEWMIYEDPDNGFCYENLHTGFCGSARTSREAFRRVRVRVFQARMACA